MKVNGTAASLSYQGAVHHVYRPVSSHIFNGLVKSPFGLDSRVNGMSAPRLVDRWDIGHAGTDTVTHLCVLSTAGAPNPDAGYALTIIYVDQAAAEQCRDVGWPEMLGVEMFMMAQIAAENDLEVREGARFLAHMVADGVLSPAPTRVEEHIAWQTAGHMTGRVSLGTPELPTDAPTV